MSVTGIPESVKFRLWGKAGGRCQYEGCNKPLYIDSLTKAEFNTAYIAHIIADQPKGPRGDARLSHQLQADISNLMLMCDEHHRLIDKIDIDAHPVDLLQDMKARHERRIELLTSIDDNKRSHVVLYGANIGSHFGNISYQKAASAMVPSRFPADNEAIELGLRNSSFTDEEKHFWQIESEHLSRQVLDKLRPRLALSSVDHLSIFALAPIPLLIKLGSLLSDIPEAEVYQLHREPPGWKWQQHTPIRFIMGVPQTKGGIPALSLSLSGTINDDRISSKIEENHSIWSLTVDKVGNDFLKSSEQLRLFRETFREVLDKIKAAHGETEAIHIFPAVPVSIAVEIGRVWMPKADLPLVIYDQNRDSGGFNIALTIPGQ